MPSFALLPSRGVLRIAGDDRVAFLQGLVSNDVREAGPEGAVFSALLTPQGKYLHDFFIAASGDALLLDCEAGRRDDLLRRLRLYRLRARVTLDDATDGVAVAAAFGEGASAALGLPDAPGAARPLGSGLAFTDPRLAALGARAMLPRDTAAETLRAAGLVEATVADYDRHRLALGVPDGSRDLEIEKTTLLEGNYDALNAISWTKGCYVGQELTARTRYRGLVKKRLVPVAVEGALPPPGTPILLDGREVGELRSGADGRALALLRLDALERLASAAATAADATVRPDRPDWAPF